MKKINLRINDKLMMAVQRYSKDKNISVNGTINYMLHSLMVSLDKRYKSESNVIKFRSAHKRKPKSS